MINREIYNIPIYSGVKGLETKLVFFETCKKINLKNDFGKLFERQGFY